MQYLQYRTVNRRHIQHSIMMNITWQCFDQSAKLVIWQYIWQYVWRHYFLKGWIVWFILRHPVLAADCKKVYTSPLTGINVVAGFCAYNVWIKLWYLPFKSSGFYNKEKLKPVLFLRYHYKSVSISLVIHGRCWTISGQVKARVVLTCTNGFSPNHLPVIVASDRPWTTLSTRAH